MKFIGIIPARYASTRFPGKPLAILAGKPMIQHVFERCSEILDAVYVATDDQRIYDAVVGFGGKAIMTSVDHKSGTDRVYEAYTRLNDEADVIINIQGDEPFIQKSQIESLKTCFENKNVDIATLVKPYDSTSTYLELQDPNTPKVIRNAQGNALYFSRSVIPYLRGEEPDRWSSKHTYYKHIGIYAYRNTALKCITKMPMGQLEQVESLEQLRWLENGLTIATAVSHIETIGIDTPKDLENAEEYIKSKYNK